MGKKNRHFALAGILLLIFLFSCAYYNTLFNAKKEYDQAIEIIQKEPDKEKHPQADQHFGNTIDKCWKLIEIYGEDSKYADDAFLYIIKSEVYIKKYAQARLHADQFLSKYPKSELLPEVYLWYGKCLLAENKVDDGKEYLHKSINTTNDSKIVAQSYYELGNLAFQNKDFEQAIEFFKKALAEKVDEQYAAFIQYFLGESYFQQEKYNAAIEHFRKVEKYSPSLDVEYKTKYDLARGYSYIGKHDDALKILRKMLTAPRFKNFVSSIKTEIANTRDRRGELQEAIFLYKEVTRERGSNAGAAQASFNLAKIYEKRIHNLDSAVYYYGQVKKLFNRFDSVNVAEEKYKFLSNLKDIRDNIKNDRRLVYRLENDRYFRDSLYSAQYEDSILQELKKITPSYQTNTKDTAQIEIDTTSTWYKLEVTELDSLKKFYSDSLSKVENDSISPFTFTPKDTIKKQLTDSLKILDQYILTKAEKQNSTDGKDTKQKVEKRKLPQIKKDLKMSRYHLAEFFLLQEQNYDSSLYYYKQFLDIYQDSVLTPKAVYSLYYIYSQPVYYDSLKKDSLENILINEYPNTSFALAIKKKKGLITETEAPDSLDVLGHNLYLKAEKLYDENEIDSALSLYKTLRDLDSTSIWAAKAQLARAHIYEKDLNDTDQAVTEYAYLENNYDFPEFTKIAKKKTAPPAPEKTAQTPDSLAQGDTLLAQNATSDTLATGTNEALAVNGPGEELPESVDTSLPNVANTQKYRQWRQRRNRR